MLRPFAAVGFCGGLTTFSTWMVESVLLTRDGNGGTAALYLLTSLVAGFAAVAVGIVGTRRALGPTSARVRPEARRLMLAWVALAGALGALARYGVHGLVQSRVASQFPFGTVVVNVTGSFVLGLVVGLATYQGLDADVRTVVGTGFIGAYTTFSSFSYETFGLFEDRATSRRARQRAGQRRARAGRGDRRVRARRPRLTSRQTRGESAANAAPS